MTNLNPQNDQPADDYLPFVSVIVPIYNSEEDVIDLVECLVNQTYSPEQTEFLLVDNNSQDNTANLLKEQIEKYQAQGKNCKYLSENQVQSSYAARNKGIKMSQGEILAFTDADCRPQPDWLVNLIKPFVNPQVSIVAGEVEGLAGNSLLEQYGNLYKTLSQKYTLEHPFAAYGQTANLAIRKDALHLVGLFRPYLTTGGDADICWRILKEIESEIIFAPSAIVFHRHRHNLTDFKNQWRRYGKSNQYLHKIYGVELSPEYNSAIATQRILTWLLKDLPITTVKVIMGKAELVEMLKIPLDLIRWQARTEGQKSAKLPEQAKEIERL
jgi:cellulose synthase/poly-beta-1,6-N-acetylglucosamine synthase-like glycosyltransferase